MVLCKLDIIFKIFVISGLTFKTYYPILISILRIQYKVNLNNLTKDNYY